MRIVSLIASSTEIVCALGFEDQLVGRSHECDYPETVQRLPVCSEPRFSPKGTCREIDQRVQTILRESLSVYRVDVDKLKELKPDVIVTQDHCEVCAVSLKDVERAVCDWLESKPRIVTLKPNTLADVWEGIHRVAEALGNPRKGDELVRKCKERIRTISEKASRLQKGTTVACIEWFDPLMASANWMPELVDMLGARSLFGEAGRRAPRISWGDLKQKDPDVMVIMPCGWDMARSRQEIQILTQKPGWDHLKAVRKGRVFVMEANQYFNRPGPRLVESFEILAEVLYPNSFHFGHEGEGWQRL